MNSSWGSIHHTLWIHYSVSLNSTSWVRSFLTMKQEKHFKSVDSEPKLLVQLCIHNSTCLSTVSSDTERQPDRSVILLTSVCALAEGAYSEARSGCGMSCFIVFLFAPFESGSLTEPGARQCRATLWACSFWAPREFLDTAGFSVSWRQSCIRICSEAVTELVLPQRKAWIAERLSPSVHPFYCISIWKCHILLSFQHSPVLELQLQRSRALSGLWGHVCTPTQRQHVLTHNFNYLNEYFVLHFLPEF